MDNQNTTTKTKNTDNEAGESSGFQTNMNKNEQKALEDIDILLDQTRPKHVVEGITSGVGTIVAGAIGACGILVLSPVVGSKTGYEQSELLGGLVGGIVGTLVGVGSAVSVAGGGIISGAGQIFRGLMNTPNSIIQPRRGKWWSTYEGKWILTHLKSEMEWIETQPQFDEDILGDEVVPDELLAQRSDVADAQARAKRYGIKDTELYDLMGVDPDATTDDIKRRYNQLGKLFSPTRQGANNPAARERYQKIGSAFVILTNDEMRARYNKYGMTGVYGGSSAEETEKNRRDPINPIKLYNMMYGSDKFNDYIGRLAAAAEASVGIQKSSKITLVQARLLQKRRVTRLAILLAERLKKFVKGMEAEARDDWEREVQVLCDTNHGIELVQVIGNAYSLTAAQFLGSFESGIGMPSISRWAQKQYIGLTTHTEKSKKDIETFAGDVKQIQLQHVAKSKIQSSGTLEVNDSVTAELFDTIGKDVLEVLWTRTVVDISTTIHEAAQMVLFDRDLNDETRKLRGKALEALGEVFSTAMYGQSTEVERIEAEYEKIAFYAVLDTIRKQEIASYNASGK